MRLSAMLVVVVTATAAPVRAAENLAPNPSFEEAAEDGGPAGWLAQGPAEALIWAEDEAHSGDRSLKITWQEAGPTISWTSEMIPVQSPDQQFLLRVWAKLEEVSRGHGAFVGFYHTDENGERIGQSGGIRIGGAVAVAGATVVTADWSEHVAASDITPEVKGLRVNLRLYGAVGTAWFDDVEVTAYRPAPLERPRPLRRGIRLQDGRCAVVACQGGTQAATRIRAALRQKGCEAPVVAHSAIDPASETRDLIVLGNLATSDAVEYLYRRSYTYEDLYYPGGGGYVLRPLVDPLGTGGNILVVGASDRAGLEAGAERLVGAIEAAKDVIDVPLTVETGEGYIDLKHLPWPIGGARRQMEPAAAYLKTGDLEHAQEYRRVMLEDARALKQRLANRDNALHLFYVTRTMSWDLMEGCGVFSDEERLEIARSLLTILRSDQGYQYVAARGGRTTKENHATRGARAFYYGWRHFSKYYREELGGELTAWRHALAQFWQWPLSSSRSYEDSLSQHALGGSMDNTLDIALQEPQWSADWFASSLAHRMGERCIAISNNMGRTVLLGDTGSGDYATSVFSKLAYALGDGRYSFMIDKRVPLGTSTDEFLRGFNAGVKPQLPEDHLGLSWVPADELYFTTALRSAEGVELEDAFDKLTFRSGFEDSDEYLMIDGTGGGSHSYEDANSIGEFSANERRWLCEMDVFNGPTMAFHNAVTVARGGLGQTQVPQSAELADSAEGEGWAYTATRLPHYNGVDWTRHTLWMPGRYTFILDEMSAREPGDYSFVLGWRSLGSPALQPGVFEAEQDDARQGGVYIDGVELAGAVADSSGKVARAMPSYNALLYRSEEPGDFVEATFQVPEAGRYELVLQTLDYTGRGIIQASIDGVQADGPIDIYHAGRPRRTDHDLGEMQLAAGEHTIRFEVVGRNEASDDCYLAICSLSLLQPGDREAAAQAARNRFRIVFPEDVPVTLDRDTETLGKYLPFSPYRDQALNILEQSMSRDLAEGEAACFFNAFCAWRGDDPTLQVRRLSEHCALVHHAGEFSLVGASADGATVQVGPVTASGRLFLLSPSRVVLHQAEASLEGQALAAGESAGDSLAHALQSAWEEAEGPAEARGERWADVPGAGLLWRSDLPDRPLSVQAARGDEGMRIAAGLEGGTVVQLDAGGAPSAEMQTGGPVHALAAADLDGDGAEELLVGSDDEHVYALDARMQELWRHRVPFLRDQQPWMWWTLGSSKVRAIHPADITGDGRPELLVGAGNMRLQCLNADGENLWRFRTDHGICTTIDTADVFGDGRNLVLAGNGLTSSNGTCWVLDESGERLTRYYNGSWCTSLPAIAVGDLDGDGVNTVITGSNRGDVRAYAPDADYTDEAWVRNLTRPIRSLTILPRAEGAVVAVGSDSGYLCAFDEAGEKVWGVALSSAIPFTALVERPGDDPLLAAGCRDGRLFLVTPAGEIAAMFEAGGRLEAVALADVSGDGVAEVIAATSSPHRVQVVAVPR